MVGDLEYDPHSSAVLGFLGGGILFFINERWVHDWNANHI